MAAAGLASTAALLRRPWSRGAQGDARTFGIAFVAAACPPRRHNDPRPRRSPGSAQQGLAKAAPPPPLPVEPGGGGAGGPGSGAGTSWPSQSSTIWSSSCSSDSDDSETERETHLVSLLLSSSLETAVPARVFLGRFCGLGRNQHCWLAASRARASTSILLLVVTTILSLLVFFGRLLRFLLASLWASTSPAAVLCRRTSWCLCGQWSPSWSRESSGRGKLFRVFKKRTLKSVFYLFY